ncbi:acyltransferase [Cryobacterium breve]|uniref:Acyltransferase n=1 Tax=Cryobacterium breve TaxID=1259258 RepID=A0ABY7NAE6_9MICO|nr:acyltransferase [Cryobacterium breve]WBM79473.1 acyltransferase [Cryobacterium breve]
MENKLTGMSARAVAPISIAEALGGHRNSLGLIRLVLACLVIFDHAFPLGGFGGDPGLTQTHGQASLGSLAVAGFFAISGYLIAKSGLATDVVQFLWRRCLRIFPAYWVVLLLTAFVAGPALWIGSGHDLSGYFGLAPQNPFHYIHANWGLSIGTWGIYDQLRDSTPYGLATGRSVFNGSIWTLIYEWQCYLLIAAAVAFGLMQKAKLVFPLSALFLLVVQIVRITNPDGPGAIAPFLADQYRVSLTLTFLLGATLAVYSRRVIYSNGLGLFSGLVLVLTLRYGGFLTIGTVAGTYFVFYVAARLPRQLHWVGSKNDYSYGVYIYGFLVEQIIASLGWYKLGYLPYAMICLVITLGCAWLSWHGVEKQAMALKDRGPGRGWPVWYAYARLRFVGTRARRRVRAHGTSADHGVPLRRRP